MGLVAATCCDAAAIQPQTKDATPLQPIAQIANAFRTHGIVALGEGNHGNEQGHTFRLSLIRDPRFLAVANDIVVEFGNSLYQDTMDRFVSGKHVPYEELRKVWQNTTQATTVWDVPIYEEFFRAVRATNEALPASRRLRVLLSDAPIRWDLVESMEDYQRQPARSDEAVAALIHKEVVAKGRRALVIYGEMHLLRRSREQTIVSSLESKGTRVFSVWTNTSADISKLQPSSASWPAPSLAKTAATPLGTSPLSFYAPANRPDEDSALPMADQFDAILYVGPLSSITYSLPAPRLCTDEEYLRMRLMRLKLSPKTAGIIARGREYCAKVAPGSENSAAFQ